MIFIGIVDPSIGDTKQLVATHIAWCQGYCKATGDTLQTAVLSRFTTAEDFLSQLSTILCTSENYKQTIYLYYFCHGIRRDGVDYIQLNQTAYVRDTTLTELYYKNNVTHLTVFYECCHGQGLYEPTDKCFMAKPANLWNVNVAVKGAHSELMAYYRNNITIICCSLETEKSLAGMTPDQSVHTLVTDILLKLPEAGLNANPFLNTTKKVLEYVNSRLRELTEGKQNMIIYSPNLLINWFC